MRIKVIAFLFMAVFTLSACETMKGFGRDLKKVGGEIEEEADR